MDARIRDERPALPDWLGRARTSGEIIADFGQPSADDLDDMGMMALNERLDQLEAGMRAAEHRRDWAERYAYGPAQTMQEREASAAYSQLIAQATQALHRSPLPEAWAAPTIPRRVFDRLAIGRPMLAAN